MLIALSGQANELELLAVNRTTGEPVTAGTVNFYLVDNDGANANKWYRGSDQTWQSSESIAGVGTHRSDGSWYISLPSACWELYKRYYLYIKESGNLHISEGDDIFVNSMVRIAYVATHQANVLTLTMVNSYSGTPITTGTVNFYLCDKDGSNAGKWYRGSDGTWQSSESIAGAGAHRADGHWYISLPSACWENKVRYRLYAKESGDLHVPVGNDILADVLMRVVEGTEKLENSPAKIMAYYIINTLGEMSDYNSGSAWPLYTTFLPDGDNIPLQCGSILDSAPDVQARLMVGPYVQRFGLQLRIRGRDYEVARTKIESIVSSLDEVSREQIVIGANTYYIHSVSRPQSIVPLGWESGTTRRVNFIVNLLVGLKKL